MALPGAREIQAWNHRDQHHQLGKLRHANTQTWGYSSMASPRYADNKPRKTQAWKPQTGLFIPAGKLKHRMAAEIHVKKSLPF